MAVYQHAALRSVPSRGCGTANVLLRRTRPANQATRKRLVKFTLALRERWFGRKSGVTLFEGEAIVTEKRVASRRRVLKGAYIMISEKAPKIECTIQNISETGAALRVSTTIGIPQHFDLLFDGMRRHCRSQWRTDTKIGVLFE